MSRVLHPVRHLDRWIDRWLADDLPHAVRLASAHHLRSIAARIWVHWELSEVRYMTEADLIVINIVGRIDGLANSLDRPW